MGFGFEFGLAFVILNTCLKNFVIVSVSQVDLNFDLGVSLSFLLYIYFFNKLNNCLTCKAFELCFYIIDFFNLLVPGGWGRARSGQ